MTMYRTARLHANNASEARAYMPDNYTVVEVEGEAFIHGRDVAGWTMSDYVIPRLASGSIVAVEVRPSDETFMAVHRAMLIKLARDAAPESWFGDGPGKYDGSSDRELTAALDFLSGDGFEAEAGTADTTGHFGRIGCAVLLTDEQGFCDASMLLDEAQAQKILDEVSEMRLDEALGEGRR